jgi:hypothetical protein
MKVWVVTKHYEHEAGHFDSAWSTEAKAKARAEELEAPQSFGATPDWAEVSEAEVDAL